MFRFFRNLRQNLLAQNRVTRYLLYALGEIVLVVIGILIALSINTWNEDRTERTLETNYLRGILENLEGDLAELERLIADDSLSLDGYTTLVRAFTDATPRSDPYSLIETIFRIQLINAFEGNSIVFDDLKSSGRTHLIRSDTLRHHLLRYYNQSDVLFASEKELHNPAILALRKELFITDEIGINGMERLFFPPHWAADLDPSKSASDYLSFLDQDHKSTEARGFANRAGYIKALILAKRRDRIRLLAAARALKNELGNFTPLEKPPAK